MSTLGFNEAMDLMRRPEARLIHTTGRGGGWYVSTTGRGGGWYVSTGGEVTDVVATKIVNHPLIRGGHDELFPDLHQTWRMIDERGKS
jgi:hypothetical protein